MKMNDALFFVQNLFNSGHSFLERLRLRRRWRRQRYGRREEAREKGRQRKARKRQERLDRGGGGVRRRAP